jgi:hypothetical protein
MRKVFEDVLKYLTPKQATHQLQLHIIEDILGRDL